MQWNDDMSVAPAGEEWVMGVIEIDPENPGLYAYESVIFDSGFWINSAGAVVDPVAWRRIEPYAPTAQQREWARRSAFEPAFQALDCIMPEGVYCVGIAVASTQEGEGALILDSCAQDIESAAFDVNVKQSILSDAQEQYSNAALYMEKLLSTSGKH